MYKLSTEQVLIMIAVIAAVTFATRLFPFVLFGHPNKRPPDVVNYLGVAFPPAILCAIIIYCFKGISFAAFPFGLPELAASAAVVGLHLWRRNTMISIFSGTLIYMLLVQVVFAP